MKNIDKSNEVSDMTLRELHEQLNNVISECGEDSEIFFQFDNKHQFVIKGISVSKCDCCDQKLPLIYGELMQ